MFRKPQIESAEPMGEIEIPEPRALIVREHGENGQWSDVTYLGHNIQTTESGGLNILRIVMMPGIGPVQQMVVGLPAGYWKRIHEEIDLRSTSPFAIQ